MPPLRFSDPAGHIIYFSAHFHDPVSPLRNDMSSFSLGALHEAFAYFADRSFCVSARRRALSFAAELSTLLHSRSRLPSLGSRLPLSAPGSQWSPPPHHRCHQCSGDTFHTNYATSRRPVLSPALSPQLNSARRGGAWWGDMKPKLVSFISPGVTNLANTELVARSCHHEL